MILAYGDYRHALGETAVIISREGVFAPSGEQLAVREHWRIEGALQAATSALLTQAIQALVDAYSQSGLNLTLYLPDGTTPSAHRIVSSQTLGGTRVVRPPSFPQGKGAEYTTYRGYSIEIEAEIPTTNSSSALLFWDEVLTFSGGGPRWTYLATLTGTPILQTLQQATPYRVTQVGRAIGYSSYPTPASPIWPLALHADESTITRKLPRRAAGGEPARDVEYEVTWSYRFDSDCPLSGDPTPRS